MTYEEWWGQYRLADGRAFSQAMVARHAWTAARRAAILECVDAVEGMDPEEAFDYRERCAPQEVYVSEDGTLRRIATVLRVLADKPGEGCAAIDTETPGA